MVPSLIIRYQFGPLGETTLTNAATATTDFQFQPTNATLFARTISWGIIAVTSVFLINNFLNNIWDLPGAGVNGAIAGLQLALYAIAIILAALYVARSKNISLRADSNKISSINTYIIRAAFWAVLLIGLTDMVISFLRVEGLLDQLVGSQMASDLGRSHFRGPYIHMPLLFVSIILAAFTRTLGFTWLALLVVAAELLIVFTRFIFSYEQSFMADLVRFWYGAMFLFASAYTLVEEGHVRVDVFYAGFKDKTKGMVNAVGSLALGITLCWTILIVGMGSKSSIINSPLFNFEVTQSGFGMYVKYLMAGFLGIFAVSMMIQFSSYFLGAVADYRGDPGKRLPQAPAAH